MLFALLQIRALHGNPPACTSCVNKYKFAPVIKVVDENGNDALYLCPICAVNLASTINAQLNFLRKIPAETDPATSDKDIESLIRQNFATDNAQCLDTVEGEGFISHIKCSHGNLLIDDTGKRFNPQCECRLSRDGRFVYKSTT